MRQLRQIRPRDVPKVLRTAAELYARDRAAAEQAEQHQAMIEAAAEVGLPSRYLELAAAAVRARRIARTRWLRRWRSAGEIGVTMALALWALSSLFTRPAPMQDPLIPAAAYPTAAPFLARVTAARDKSPTAGPAAGATRGNLLANGSFEAAGVPCGSGVLPFGVIVLSGWRVVRGTVDVVPMHYWQQATGQGDYSLDLAGTPGHATIEQTFPTRPGRAYRFFGWLAHNPERQTQEGRADVLINGRRVMTLCHRDAQATRSEMRWVRFSCRFRASGRETTLRLVDVTRTSEVCGAVLDGLAVTRTAGGQE